MSRDLLKDRKDERKQRYTSVSYTIRTHIFIYIYKFCFQFSSNRAVFARKRVNSRAQLMGTSLYRSLSFSRLAWNYMLNMVWNVCKRCSQRQIWALTKHRFAAKFMYLRINNSNGLPIYIDRCLYYYEHKLNRPEFDIFPKKHNNNNKNNNSSNSKSGKSSSRGSFNEIQMEWTNE